VRPGVVFVAVPGTRLDGAEFAQYAIRQGAVAVVATEAGLATIRASVPDLAVPVFLSAEPRAELARLAALWHGAQPATIAAVTGTNGKTSVAQFLMQIWRAAGHPAAALGTLGVTGAGLEAPLAHTTPDPLTLHAALARLAAQGCTHAAMEASSHGLAQHRVDGVRLASAALTNITRDHMDYHASHADYVAAKLRLFGAVLPAGGTAVINADDPVFAEAAALARGRGQRVIAVGRGAEADLRISDQRFSASGQTVSLHWQGATWEVALDLVGAFQAENAAIAAALALATGTAPGEVRAALPALQGAPGRMQRTARRSMWIMPTRRMRWPRRSMRCARIAGGGWRSCSARAGTATGASAHRWAQPPPRAPRS